jgi:hypothetical protein
MRANGAEIAPRSAIFAHLFTPSQEIPPGSIQPSRSAPFAPRSTLDPTTPVASGCRLIVAFSSI